jgi:hypothetical protein
MSETLSKWTATRFGDVAFPDSLMIVPTGEHDMPSYTRDAYVRHNQAVQEWRRRNVGAVSSSRPSEYALLDMLAAIEQLVSVHGSDGYNDEHIIGPMLGAIGDWLNLDLGRLDGSAISSWVGHIAEECGIDRDML